MKTDYKHIYFTLVDEKPKTKIWACYNNNNETFLGFVRWGNSWRQYCFFPEHYTVFSSSCMKDINHFIEQAMKIKRG